MPHMALFGGYRNMAQTSKFFDQVFTGADVVVIFGDEYIGECMSFTVGVNRETGPLYVMGFKEPVAIPKGKRGVGGSFILAQLGYEALLKYYKSIVGTSTKNTKIWVRKDEQSPDPNKNGGVSGSAGGAGDLGAGTASNLFTSLEQPNYADQMPPFNITVVGVNERGLKTGFRVYGVTIINEGMAISVEELNMEKRYTFIAQSVSAQTILQ